eukprot:GHVU01011936.1.p1 GENE.GHVU01011936.1~~GHVU01011936.1.p1  ORF type:complete len:187 (-),score=12.83 GHVU01011936.1:406-966(-)
MSHKFGENTTAEEVGQALSANVKGKNVLITGVAPDGLGGEAARVTAKYANLVIIAGRNLDKLEQSVKQIKSETPAANIRTLVVDFTSLESVRRAAAEVIAYSEPINVLINNAGIMASPYSVTAEGFESQFGTNHLAPFLFTALIFPRLVEDSSPSSPSRVINISSRGHFFWRYSLRRSWILCWRDI